MKKDKHAWILFAVIAAIVAVVTAVVVYYFRQRQKAAKVSEPIYDCGSCEVSDCACDCDESQEIVTE